MSVISFPVVEGGVEPLSSNQRNALQEISSVLRSLPDDQAETLARIVQEMTQDHYLERARDYEIPVVKILAEVINGWDAPGVYEFARAWTSTLVARDDGFEWDHSDARAREAHRQRIRLEMARRGL